MTAAHERPHVVAVDVGGTSIKGARVNADGLVAACHAIRTPVTDGPTAVITAIRALVQSLLDPSVVAVGLVVPGDVDGDAGVARYSANLGWRDVPLRQVVGDDTGLPTVLAHDVHAAALAEREIGVARDLDDVVVVAIGTGIAAVSVCAGREVDGAAGLAGEIGHLAVVADGEPCPCGQRGCLERYASAAAVARRYAERTGRRLRAEDVVARRESDEAADAVWREATDALATALAACTMMIDPDVFALTGGLAAAGAALAEPVRTRLAELVRFRPVPPVIASSLAADAGRTGAAILAWRLGAH
ncbi:MAG TPA: ROK family protein [Jatrophihabitantaceae bacterium]